MIKRFSYGKIIETDAVQNKPGLTEAENAYVQSDGSIVISLDDKAIIYGLGENVRGINKRGWIYESNCADDPNHTEGTRSLYGAHNFFVVSRSIDDNIGFFVDTPSKVSFDMAYTKPDEIRIVVESGAYELYIIEGENAESIVNEFRTLIGRSYIPPVWALGYGQSRWSYMSADEVRDVIRRHRENDIPIDSVYLDIDYMERYKDFTINEESFPEFDSFVSEVRADNIHLVPIIDAGVKVEAGYEVYEEGREKGYFCKDEDGEDFIVGVWPGRCCFPDMLNEEAGAWFADKYKVLTDKGIDGFWNDMNEPAIFYSEKKLSKFFDEIEAYKNTSLDINTFFEMREKGMKLSNCDEDYAAFYHNYRGEKVNHKDVHNLFGYYMTRSASEAFDRISPDKRILLYSRASYIGMHRYGGIWQGDNASFWSHLAMNFKMMPGLNMCGFLYTGADLGGFGGDTTEDLMVRWLSVSLFTPLMRNHSAKGTRRQEVYDMSLMDKCRDLIRLRYRFIPFIYSEFLKAALEDRMMFKPLGFIYDDEIARHVEDQLFIGDDIMVAPILEQNAIGRGVYIPEPMKMVRFRECKIIEETIYEQGYHFVKMPLGDVCVWIRMGHKLVLGPVCDHVDADKIMSVFEDDGSREVIAYDTDNEAKYLAYIDDGISKDMSKVKIIEV